MEKMSAKEFKEIVKRCGIDNSYESCLSIMASYYYDESHRVKKQGYTLTAEWYQEIGDIMLNELDNRGYFD